VKTIYKKSKKINKKQNKRLANVFDGKKFLYCYETLTNEAIKQPFAANVTSYLVNIYTSTTKFVLYLRLD